MSLEASCEPLGNHMVRPRTARMLSGTTLTPLEGEQHNIDLNARELSTLLASGTAQMGAVLAAGSAASRAVLRL